MSKTNLSAWESSPEGIHYQLQDGPTLAGVRHSDIETLIVKTVSVLPTEVREFTFDNCFFATVGGGICGQVLPPDCNGWLILLDANMPNEHGEDEVLGIIAHEIAHAFLGHNLMDTTSGMEIERAAANQTAAWGFVGIGADADYCAKE